MGIEWVNALQLRVVSNRSLLLLLLLPAIV
jgi:hypothetical protein